MCNEISEDGYIWFGLDFGSVYPGQVSFGSDELRRDLRSNPKMIGTVLFRMLLACCDELVENENEREMLVSGAHDEIGRWIKSMDS